jgi:hypothetical protein
MGRKVSREGRGKKAVGRKEKEDNNRTEENGTTKANGSTKANGTTKANGSSEDDRKMQVHYRRKTCLMDDNHRHNVTRCAR